MSALAPQITASHPAAVSAMQPQAVQAKLAALQLPTFTQQEKADNAQKFAFGVDQKTAKELVYGLVEGGVPVPGAQFLSAPTGLVASLFSRDFYAKSELDELTNHYRDFVAAQMNVPAEQVDESHLKACAMQDEGLASALLAVAHRRDTHVVTNAGGLAGLAGGAAAGGALGTAILPGIGTVAGLVGGLVGGIAGYEVGEGASKYVLGVTDHSDPEALCQALQKKKQDGGYVSTEDVFALKLAMKPERREQVVERHGDNFARLDEQTQKEVMFENADITREAAKDAVLCNFPEADLRGLMVGGMRSPLAANSNLPASANDNGAPVRTQWTSQIAGQRGSQTQMPRETGFAEAVLRGREALGSDGIGH